MSQKNRLACLGCFRQAAENRNLERPWFDLTLWMPPKARISVRKVSHFNSEFEVLDASSALVSGSSLPIIRAPHIEIAGRLTSIAGRGISG